jgi:CRP-like cAMP-binding protein
MTQPDPSIVAALAASKLAAELSPGQIEVLSGQVAMRELRAGEVLVREGVADNHLYAVVSGKLGVIKHAGTPDEERLATMQAGDFAGELAFLDGTERFASLVALEDMQVLGLEREKFESLVDTHPQIVYRVMRAIVRTVHLLQRRLSMESHELRNYVYKQHGRY